MRRSFTCHWLGRVPYREAHALQERVLAARLRGEVGDTVLLLEHDPVITLGRGADEGHILLPVEARPYAGIDVVETGRGGDVTYHGPGQLVAYPIVDLRPDRCDVRRYVQDLAAVMVGLAARHGVGAKSLQGDAKLIGVWVDLDAPGAFPEGPVEGRRIGKIGAIGVRLSRWVTMHGFAFNGATDLSHFDLIVPCGITQYGVTSLKELRGEAPAVQQLAEASVPLFGEVFDADVRLALAEETEALRRGGAR